MKMSTRLRELLTEPGLLVMPGVYDCISLKIVAQLGFPVALHGGYNSGASVLGLPDVGLITMTESVGFARNMAAVAEIPVICDVDDGFGGLLNVDRATREVIRSGLAGLLIEDQEAPRRSPSLGGSQVIPADAMERKLRVVSKVRAHEDPDLIIVARTYSSRIMGMKEAVRRGRAYAEAGADLIWVDPGYSEQAIEEFRTMASEIGPYVSVVANMSETVGRPLLTNQELHAMGFKMVTYPVTALMAAAGGVATVMKELKDRGTTRAVVDKLMPLKQVAKLAGNDRVREFEEEWGSIK